jgi:hypothetical protein
MLLHACRWCIKVNAEVLVTLSCGVPRHLVLLSGYQHSVPEGAKLRRATKERKALTLDQSKFLLRPSDQS